MNQAQEYEGRASLDYSTIQTNIMVINSYEVASKIVTAIAMVFEKQIPNIMKVDNVTILSSAQLTDEAIPVNINPVMVIIIGFIMGLMLAIGLVFLLDYLDDTFKNEAEILKELNLPTIAMIKHR